MAFLDTIDLGLCSGAVCCPLPAPAALTTMPMLFCCPPCAISTHSSMTRFMKGSKPRRMPCTWRPPFSFTARNALGVKGRQQLSPRGRFYVFFFLVCEGKLEHHIAMGPKKLLKAGDGMWVGINGAQGGDTGTQRGARTHMRASCP